MAKPKVIREVETETVTTTTTKVRERTVEHGPPPKRGWLLGWVRQHWASLLGLLRFIPLLAALFPHHHEP